MNDADIEVVEIVPGELDAVVGHERYRILLPAGVGVPGLEDVAMVRALVAELIERGAPLADVVDVSALLRRDPGLLTVVARRVETDGDGSVA